MQCYKQVSYTHIPYTVICARPWQLKPLVRLLIFSGSTWTAMARGFLLHARGLWMCAALRVKPGKWEIIRTHHSVLSEKKVRKSSHASTFWCSSDVPIEVTLKSVKSSHCDVHSVRTSDRTAWCLCPEGILEGQKMSITLLARRSLSRLQISGNFSPR